MVFKTAKWVWSFEVIEKTLTFVMSPPRQHLSQTVMLKARHVLWGECGTLGNVL
jgi:hypothetical protein